MEVLNSMIEEADRRGELLPLPGDAAWCRASVYADDLVIFLAPSTKDFTTIRRLLGIFVGASGLVTNIDKCTLTPIGCLDEDLASIVQSFPCRVEEFPTKYLGAPLSIRRLARDKEQAIVDSVVQRIPRWKAGLLNAEGRATLTRTTLSTIPVRVSICHCLSSWAIHAINKARRGFLWASK